MPQKCAVVVKMGGLPAQFMGKLKESVKNIDAAEKKPLKIYEETVKSFIQMATQIEEMLRKLKRSMGFSE